ncbi:MAG: CAP domain-containing protein [Nocardioides sp.]|nr:CAP domain-containing protein [Nocardioides sp.]
MARIVATLAAALLAVIVAPAQAATPAQTYAGKIMSATNTVRVNHELPKFRGNLCVKGFAVRQARRMATQERMFHQNLGPVLSKCGLRTAGENVAFGFPTGRAVVLQGWVRSPSHLANILDRGFRLLGAAARKSDDGVWYAAQVFGTKL